MKEIIKTMYEADDGTIFSDQKSALQYEEQKKVWDNLKPYIFDGPRVIPSDEPRLIGYDYIWLKLNTKEEFDIIKVELNKITPIKSLNITKFPNYICYSKTFKTYRTFTEIQKIYKLYQHNWESFMSYFK